MVHKQDKNLDRFKQAALDYHKAAPEGKIEVIPSKPHATQRDLALAYSPGVAEPCLAIEQYPMKVYDYTTKGNLVAVISNGTAVLGLGDIGAEASKPVMEGKGLLFKIFANINVFDIEINEKDPEKFVEIVKAIAPTFGGINLEDIKAPEAFYIEQRLKNELDIPLMHDDQHGTAIISGAALLNALEIAGKDIAQVKMVINGAGAAAIACANIYIALGVQRDHIIMCDSKGVLNQDRNDLTEEKIAFVRNTSATQLEEAIQGSDVFIGLSKGNVMTADMLLSMNEQPIVFALANPDPEIDYQLAIDTRPDVIMATGRSDYPNQVNNVLGFPYIFRGALDVRATGINEPMKLAAVHAIAGLAKEPVPEMVKFAYNLQQLKFGKDYIIPKPFDTRLLPIVSSAVARAAVSSGIARKPIEDYDAYQQFLLEKMGKGEKVIRMMQTRAKRRPMRVTLDNAEEYNVLKAAQILQEEGIAHPILLGEERLVRETMERYGIEFDATIIDPNADAQQEKRHEYKQLLWDIRQRKGINEYQAKRLVRRRDYYGPLMLRNGDTDALIVGYSKKFSTVLQPIIEVLEKEPGVDKVAAMMMILTKNKPLFFADTSINPDPSTQDIVNIARLLEEKIKSFTMTPRIALLSYENFSANSPTSKKMAAAVSILHRDNPDMIVDGEIQADFALSAEQLQNYPFSKLGDKPANAFVFPNLESANMSYKMLRGIGAAQTVGPIALGFKQSVHILQMRSSIEEIVNLATIAVIDAQNHQPL